MHCAGSVGPLQTPGTVIARGTRQRTHTPRGAGARTDEHVWTELRGPRNFAGDGAVLQQFAVSQGCAGWSTGGAVSNDNSRGHGCSNEWVAGRVPRPRGVHSPATRARVVRVKRKQHVAAQESCCSRTPALRNDIWVPSIRACRSVHDNTIVRDILEPPTHALPTTWRQYCQLQGGAGPAGPSPPVEG